MNLKELERHYQGLIRMKDAQLGELREEVRELKQILKGESGKYMRRYGEIVSRMSLAERRVMDYLKTRIGQYIHQDKIENRVMNMYRGQYKRGTLPRCMRKLREQGALLVDYVDNHPHYTVNVRYLEEVT